MARLFLVVGLPGAGKSTYATELAATQSALRLTPDAWMIPLFDDSEAGDKRDVLEGRLIWTAAQVLRLGTNVILDFGLWGRDERSALAWLALSIGATCQVVYLAVDRPTQLERTRRRWRYQPGDTFDLAEEDLDRWRGQFDEPTNEELAGEFNPVAPAGWTDWGAWIADRWPTAHG